MVKVKLEVISISFTWSTHIKIYIYGNDDPHGSMNELSSLLLAEEDYIHIYKKGTHILTDPSHVTHKFCLNIKSEPTSVFKKENFFMKEKSEWALLFKGLLSPDFLTSYHIKREGESV